MKRLLVYIWALIVLGIPIGWFNTLKAATLWYVATTGNDTTGNGTSGNPWRNPQKCADSAATTGMANGDICVIKAGTYGDPNPGSAATNGHYVVVTSGSAPLNITMRAEVPGTVTITMPNVSTAGNRAFYFLRSGWTLEGVRIAGDGNGVTSNTGVLIGADNVTVRYVFFDSMGRGLCTNSANSNAAISVQASNAIIEYNYFYKIGRKRNGELGCVTDKFQHDHGIYAIATTAMTVRRNVFNEVNRGFGVQIFKSGGGTTTQAKIYHNDFYNPTPGVLPHGCIILSNTVTNSEIKNNLFGGCTTSAISFLTGTTTTNVTISYNRQDVDDTSGDNITAQTPPSGTTTSNNTDNSALGFVDVASGNFALTSTSNAINAGTAITGYSFNGAAPDQGAFETFTGATATVTGNTLDLQFGMNLHTPLVIGDITGFTVNNGRTVTAVDLVGSSIARITFNGAACTGVQTWTVTYNQNPGTATDGSAIGSSLYQPAWDFGPITATNLCAAGPSYTFTQTQGGIYEAVATQETSRLLTRVSPGGCFAVRTKYKATGADPPAVTTKLQTATDGESGTFADVPDTFGAANLKYIGMLNLTGLPAHATPLVLERLPSEFSGMTAGAVQLCFVGCISPSIDLAQDAETEQVDIVCTDTDAGTTTWWFRRVQSDNSVLTYGGGSKPSITASPPQSSGVGF